MSGQYVGTRYYYKPRPSLSVVTNTAASVPSTSSRFRCLRLGWNRIGRARTWLINVCRLKKKILILGLLVLLLLLSIVSNSAIISSVELDERIEILKLRGVRRENDVDEVPMTKSTSNHFVKTCTIYDPATKVNHAVEITQENMWNVTLMAARLSLSPLELQLLFTWMASSSVSLPTVNQNQIKDTSPVGP